MVREITSVTSGTPVPEAQVRHAKITKAHKDLVPITPSAPQNLSKKYSSENVKANFLTFSKSNKASKVSFGAAPSNHDYAQLKAYYDIEPSFKTNVTNLPDHKKITTPFYEETANNIAIAMGADKNVVLAHDEEVTPELLVHKFADNVKNDKYRRQGLDSFNTEVYLLDSLGAATKNVVPHTVVDMISKTEPRTKHVVFVQDMPVFIGNLEHNGINPSSYLSEMAKKNVQIIGLIPKKMLEPKTQEQLMKGEREFPKAYIKDMPRVDFDGLGVSDTKELLKNQSRFFTRPLFNKYNKSGVILSISDKATDILVDKSSTKIDSAFPNKAIKVLDMVAAAKLQEQKTVKHPIAKYKTESETGVLTFLPAKTTPKKSARVIITAKDVENFFVNHGDLLKGLKTDNDKRFTVAENVTTKLNDVGGIKEIKQDIKDGILAYLKDPKKYVADGQKAPKGFLLHGEPGTGKTLLARAIAGEAGVPFIAASGSEFVEQYVGVGAKRVRELFGEARKAAAQSEKKTAIIFIDEIDAVGRKRTGAGGGSQETESTLNQILTEMDGFNNKESKVKVIVIAATNQKDILDPALVRPGRFDDLIEMTAVSQNSEARREVVEIHTRDKKFASEADKIKVIDHTTKMTQGMTGAEIAEMMNKSAKIVAKRPENKFITNDDVVEGFLQVAVGKLKKSDMTDADKEMVVRHEGGHAVVLDTLKHSDINFITLDERGSFLGAVFHEKSKEMPNFKSVVANVATSYAGGMAEPRYNISGHGAGVSGDLENATHTIQKAVTKWGLGVHTPQLSLDEKSPFLGTYSKEVKKDMELFSKTGSKVAKLIVDFHKDFLDDYVEKYKANAGKGGNILTGESFSELRSQWIKDTGKEKQFAKLQNKINRTIKIAQNSDKGINKLLFRFI